MMPGRIALDTSGLIRLHDLSSSLFGRRSRVLTPSAAGAPRGTLPPVVKVAYIQEL